MPLNESTVEEAALEYFFLRQGYGGHVGELGFALGNGAAFAWLRRAKPEIGPGEAAAERRVHRRNRSIGSISTDSRTNMSTMMTDTATAATAQAGR